MAQARVILSSDCPARRPDLPRRVLIFRRTIRGRACADRRGLLCLDWGKCGGGTSWSPEVATSVVGVRTGVAGLAGVVSAVAVFVLSPLIGSGASSERTDGTAVPSEMAGYSHLTGSVSDSPPGRAVALYQHGYGVEFLDFPQAVVLGASGDTYRRVDAAEDRAGPEAQGDPAPMLLSPDGASVAVGDHITEEPDVVIVDLLTGDTVSHALPEGRSVVPVAWSRDGRRLAHLLTAGPTSPHRGEPIVGDVGVLDLQTGETTMLRQARKVRTAAFSPDGTQLAVQQDVATGEQLAIVDIDTDDTIRVLVAEGELAGPASWSPDGRLLATTTVRQLTPMRGIRTPTTPTGLEFVDPTGRGEREPESLKLPLTPDGRVVGWSSSDQVLALTVPPGQDDGFMGGPDVHELSSVPLDGSEPRALMRISGLQSFGVNRFQLADATVDELEVVTPAAVDRGPLPLAARGAPAVLTGLFVWLVARHAERQAQRRSQEGRQPAAPTPDAPPPRGVELSFNSRGAS